MSLERRGVDGEREGGDEDDEDDDEQDPWEAWLDRMTTRVSVLALGLLVLVLIGTRVAAVLGWRSTSLPATAGVHAGMDQRLDKRAGIVLDGGLPHEEL